MCLHLRKHTTHIASYRVGTDRATAGLTAPWPFAEYQGFSLMHDDGLVVILVAYEQAAPGAPVARPTGCGPGR